MEGTFSRLRLGLAGGRGPEVDGRRPVGRSSRDLPKAPVLLAEPREWRRRGWGEGGLGPMSAAAGRDGWVVIGRKGQKVKGGHGLVAVAARVRQTQTDRRGKETKRAHKRGT